MNKFKYDVSVVIPVYNAADYLDECIQSLISQKYSFEKIEIILINDGSKDNSLDICKLYESKYNNIKLINQKNQGVSVARNNGIKNSKGKYIMLLDSDDTLSSNTINNLYCFFEKNYNNVDIVTYPIYFNRNGKYDKNIRYNQYDKGTGIYDINEYIYLNQSTVNIIIKNEFENTNLYNVNMKLSEDQNFDTELIMKKQKIGYVEDAIYYYRRYDASVSATRNNPYYCFDDIMSYNEMLLKKYKINNIIPKYIQSLVINTLKWRISSDQLYPYFLDNVEFDKAVERIKKILRNIDVDVIINLPDMNYYHKLYFLKLADHKIDFDIKNSILVYVDNQLISEHQYIDGLVSRLKYKNNKLYFTASLLNPILENQNIDIYLEKKLTNGKIISKKLEYKQSNDSYYLSNIKTTVSYIIDTSFEINNVKSFKVYAKIKNKKIYIQFKMKKFVSNNFFTDKLNILYSKENNIFKIRKANIINKFKSRFRNFNKCKKKNKKICVYRLLSYFYFKYKNTWIYTDRGDMVDNAYIQFLHDIKEHDGIKRYYVCNFDTEEKNKYFSKDQQKYLIRKNSFKHKMIFLKCSKIITSFIDLQIYSPFVKIINYYKDLTRYELIYLQHGILHANLRKMYSKEFTEIDRFVISTIFEEKNLINNYNYRKEDLLYSGMPRISNNINKDNKQYKILFVPSWRKYLIGNLINNKRKLKIDTFLSSSYYNEIVSLLNNKELCNFLKKNNYKLDFKLHPIFKEYTKYFNCIDNDYVNIILDEINIEEYSILITDFSSFQFDFVKLKRPIIYFVPDIKEFKAGLHSYKELDLKYEDAFGNLFIKNNELINEIKRIINNNCIVDNKYLNRMNNLFLKTKDPKELIYNELINKL